MTNEPKRRYSAEEATAFRAAGMDVFRGPAEFAGGPWWPDELDRRADEAEALAPKLRLAAAALRREIAADPRTATITDASPVAAAVDERKTP